MWKDLSMDDLMLPRGACFSPEERNVPYLGSKDYLGVPSLKYPKLTGFNFVFEKCEDGGAIQIDLPTLRLEKERMTQNFLQTWLFCGLLQESFECSALRSECQRTTVPTRGFCDDPRQRTTWC